MALVEAGYALGDRLLYHTHPMIRGDDVAELQHRLGGLGFDAGRVDGIFGPDTAGALLEFQRHSGLAADGVTGPETLDQLARLGGRITEPGTVAGVRERQRLRDAPRELRGRMLVVAHHGGMDALAQALARNLTRTGARAVVLQHHDPSTVAEQANALAAEVLIALEVGDGSSWCAYYQSAGFESPGGRRLADLVVDQLVGCGVDTPATEGMRLPVLRETRMPAVVVHLGPASVAVTHTAEIARAASDAVAAWVASPVTPDD
jgi:N-acetylmuramoyl-L-alanine amidase